MNFADLPLVLEDSYGIRFIRYPWDKRPIERLLSREFYKTEFNAIRKLIQQGNIVFDIGANIGLHSVFISRLIGPSGNVYAFEPVADTYWMLRETLALNRCENVIPIQLAICDKVGIVTMNIFDIQYCDYNTMGQAEMPGLGGERVRPKMTMEVRSETIDNFCEREAIETIDFLKVDVEGLEKYVFIGAQNLLKRGKVKFISFEISQDPLRGAGIKSREVFEVLESYGYQSYSFTEATQSFEGPVRNSNEYYAVYFASRFGLSSVGR